MILLSVRAVWSVATVSYRMEIRNDRLKERAKNHHIHPRTAKRYRVATAFGVHIDGAEGEGTVQVNGDKQSARKDCFDALDFEQYKIIETLDGHTCELCGDLDGKVYRREDYEVGRTANPFHPWCRRCTAPYFEEIGVRDARDEKGKVYNVPANMIYKEWREKHILDAVSKEGRQDFDRDKMILGKNAPETLENLSRLSIMRVSGGNSRIILLFV